MCDVTPANRRQAAHPDFLSRLNDVESTCLSAAIEGNAKGGARVGRPTHSPRSRWFSPRADGAALFRRLIDKTSSRAPKRQASHEYRAA